MSSALFILKCRFFTIQILNSFLQITYFVFSSFFLKN
nr:MAG TPA: hypothetical protein [Bacteriophage sp.]